MGVQIDAELLEQLGWSQNLLQKVSKSGVSDCLTSVDEQPSVLQLPKSALFFFFYYKFLQYYNRL